jgi:L-fuculose-phosphate aldolase
MSGKPIPAAHSMIALFGAPIVRCAKYAPAGTKELAGLTLEALDQSHAVLLSNYCALTTGPTLEAALFRARTRNARPALRNHPFTWSSGDTFR